MAIAKKMKDFVANGSMIRRMFEEGKRLKAIYGEDKVFDFSIGNPDLPVPDSIKAKIIEVSKADAPDLHAYMPNAGLPEARAAVAGRINRDQGLSLKPEHLVLTCGAAAALNISFKALLEAGDEVLVSAPYFVEYGFIADNHGGVLKTVPTLSDFSLDLAALEAGIQPRTKIVLVNSPNNPTGRIYSSESLAGLAEALKRKSQEYGHVIYLISDEPYRRLAYGGVSVPSPMASYPNSLIASSFAKDLSLPGERLGYVAVNPEAEDAAELVAALSLANRILGFVNAPSLMQKVVAEIGDECVDVGIYQRRRDRLVSALSSFGYQLGLPEGAFYLFVKAPGGNEETFLSLLKAENILVVPGSGFGAPGYFRLAYCVEDRVIEASLPGFERAIRASESESGFRS